MDYSASDDTTLVNLITQSEPDALSELYSRYRRLVFSMAFNLSGDRHLAEEATLKVFTRIWEKADSYQAARGSVKTWLTTITRHQTIDALRRQGTHLEQNSFSWADLSPNTSSNHHGPEEQTERTLQRERVRTALTELPVEQRQALALAYFAGYKHRQIAELLDQPLGTIKTRIRLALKKLRKLLDDEHISI